MGIDACNHMGIVELGPSVLALQHCYWGEEPKLLLHMHFCMNLR